MELRLHRSPSLALSYILRFHLYGLWMVSTKLAVCCAMTQLLVVGCMLFVSAQERVTVTCDETLNNDG